MIALNWNSLGLRHPRLVQDLCLMEHDKHLEFVFLMKTKLNGVHMDLIKSRLGFTRCLVVNALGKKGGLAML